MHGTANYSAAPVHATFQVLLGLLPAVVAVIAACLQALHVLRHERLALPW